MPQEDDRRAAPPELAADDSRRLFEAAPAAYAVLLPDAPCFTIVAATDVYRAAAGLRREAAIGRGLFEALPAADAVMPPRAGLAMLRRSLETTVRTRRPQRMRERRSEVRDAASGGIERTWGALNVPVLGPDDTVPYVLHHAEDGSMRAGAEAAERRARTGERAARERVREAREGERIARVAADIVGDTPRRERAAGQEDEAGRRRVRRRDRRAAAPGTPRDPADCRRARHRARRRGRRPARRPARRRGVTPHRGPRRRAAASVRVGCSSPAGRGRYSTA